MFEKHGAFITNAKETEMDIEIQSDSVPHTEPVKVDWTLDPLYQYVSFDFATEDWACYGLSFRSICPLA
jgi:hypothetical protein